MFDERMKQRRQQHDEWTTDNKQNKNDSITRDVAMSKKDERWKDAEKAIGVR